MDWLGKIEEEIDLLQKDNDRLRELLRRAERFVYCCYSHPKQKDMGPVSKMLDDITETLGP